jgi:hypothetical protein
MKRNLFGRVVPHCTSQTLHASWGEETSSILTSGSYVSRPVINKLLELSCLSPTTKSVSTKFCESCLENVVAQFPELAKPKQLCAQSSFVPVKEDEPSDDMCTEISNLSIETVCTQTLPLVSVNVSTETPHSVVVIDGNIDLSHLTPDERVRLAYSLGSFEAINVACSTSNVSDIFNNVDNLESLDLEEYLSQLNPVVVAFISGVGKLPLKRVAAVDSEFSDSDKPEAYMICKTVESIANLSAV